MRIHFEFLLLARCFSIFMLVIGYVAVVMLFGVLDVSPVLAQQASNVTITYNFGMHQLCVVERNL